jgi:O-antigen/teichoic acid export membrane protein
MTRAEKFLQFADTAAVRRTLKQKSVHGILFMFGAGGVDFVIRLASTFLLARLLSPTDFGLVAMVISVTAIAERFSELGLSTATIQCRELTHQQVTNLFWINVAAGCLLSLVICGLAPGIAKFYENPGLLPLTLTISTTFIWGGLTVQHQALLSRQLKQAQLGTVRLGASFLSLLLTIVLAVNHFGVWSLAWREVARAFFVAAGMWLFCRWLPGLPRRNAGSGALLRYGSHLTLNGLVNACLAQLDRLLIGRFFGAGPLGLYRQAQQLLVAPIEQLQAPVYSVASPGLSMLQGDPGRYRRYFQRIALVISLPTMPLGMYVAMYAEEITHVVLGPKWIASTAFLRIFGLVTCLKPVLDSSGVVMLTFGLSKRLLLLAVICNAVSAIFMFAGIPWGAAGIALSNVVAIVVMMFPRLYFSFRRTPVTVGAFLGAISTPVFATLVMAGGLLLFRSFTSHYEVGGALFSSLGLAVVLYTAVLFLLPRGRREIGSLILALATSFQGRRHPAVKLDQASDHGAVGSSKASI